MNQIRYKKVDFPFKEVEFPFGFRIISTEKLNVALMNSSGSYKSEKARMLDEGIFYYVQESLLNMNDTIITQTILSEL